MSPVSLLCTVILLASCVGNSHEDSTDSIRCSQRPSGDCTFDDVSYNCSYSTCDSVPGDISPDIREIRLRGNRIQRIDKNVSAYAQLELLDLSENKVNAIEVGAFPDTLLALNLSSNDITLDTISQQRVFDNLQRLEYLYLANNKLENLTIPNVFSPWLPAIRLLDLSANKIESLAHNVLTDMVRLEVLDLSGNQIRDPDSSDFLGLYRLILLNMTKNRMESIPERMFTGMSALKTIDLSDNMIERVSDSSFDEAGHLETLHLERNLIRVLPTALCFPMKKLKSLYLDGNPLESIEYGSITPTLKLLSIQKCESLKEISLVIQAQADLDEVLISHNRQLESISEYALGVGTRVRHLDLSNNALTSLSEQLVQWSNVTTANLNGNYLDCDCHLLWIKNLPEASPVLDSIVCYNPLHLRGSLAKHLDRSQFSCSMVSRYRRHGAIVVAVLFTVIVVCSVVLVVRRFKHRLWPSLYPTGKYETLYSSAEADADDDASQPVTIKKKYTTSSEEPVAV